MKDSFISRSGFLTILTPLFAVALFLSLSPHSALAQYTIDDGIAENAIGLSGGGDVIAFNSFQTLPSNNVINSISIAFGSGGGTTAGNVALNGTSFTAVLWSDPNGDGNPLDAVVLATAVGVVSGAGTNFFITLNIAPTMVSTANFFVGFKITHPAGSFPAALDQTAPTFANRSFIAAGATGTGNINNLAANLIPPTAVESIGSPGNWLIRANGTSAAVPDSGTTALLLGLGMVGLVASQRLMERRKLRTLAK